VSTLSPGAPGSAVKKLQVEGQFMNWLLRLSMSSASANAIAGAAASPVRGKGSKDRKGKKTPTSAKGSAVSELLLGGGTESGGGGGGMQTLHEWTTANVQSFGPFFNINARLGCADSASASAVVTIAAGAPASAQKGKRGQAEAEAGTPYGAALDFSAFEQVVLNHFFVFDNVSAAPLRAPAAAAPDGEGGAAVNVRLFQGTGADAGASTGSPTASGLTHVHSHRHASPSPEREVAEGLVWAAQAQALAGRLQKAVR
jgi:hypothetical protein